MLRAQQRQGVFKVALLGCLDGRLRPNLIAPTTFQTVGHPCEEFCAHQAPHSVQRAEFRPMSNRLGPIVRLRDDVDGLLSSNYRRRFPSAVKDRRRGFFGQVQAEHDAEFPFRSGQPIRLFVLAGRVRLKKNAH